MNDNDIENLAAMDELESIKSYIRDIHSENDRYKSFINSLLNPEEYGYAVSNEVRDAARIALGMEPVESCLAKRNRV